MIFFALPPPGPLGLSISISLGALGTAGLIVAAYRLRQTTLTASAYWGVAALGLLTISCGYSATLPTDLSSLQRLDDASTWNYLRYSAAALIVAPTLAQLGAKRPQNAAWQFIVLTLVGILLLPVIQGWAYGDDRPNVHGLFRWLLLVHVFIGVGNYLFTRYAAATILFGIGQLALIAEYLPFGNYPESRARELLGLLCICIAITTAFALARTRPTKSQGFRNLWRCFRDAFGAVWTLRIAERLNASAKLHRWPVEFSWTGVEMIPPATNSPQGSLPENGIGIRTQTHDLHDLSALSPELQHRIERELRSYLRRFVSHDWIVERLQPDNVS